MKSGCTNVQKYLKESLKNITNYGFLRASYMVLKKKKMCPGAKHSFKNWLHFAKDSCVVLLRNPCVSK